MSTFTSLTYLHRTRTRTRTRLGSSSASRLVHPSAPVTPVTDDALRTLVTDLASSAEADAFDPRPGERGLLRLLRTEQIEAWLISWTPSSFLGLHDHGGSRGAFRVLDGRLDEMYTDGESRSPLQVAHLEQGAIRSFGPSHIHEVWNPSSVTALSVHVYSPPLHQMRFYSHEDQRFLEITRTETSAEWDDTPLRHVG